MAATKRSKLRAVAPSLIEKRGKFFFFGESGVGKTTAAIQFPQPYLIDTERGAENREYVKLLESKGGAVMGVGQGSDDLETVVNEVRMLRFEQHDYQTLIIDPVSVIYAKAVDASAEITGDTSFGRHKQEPDRLFRKLLGNLQALDMNVILTSHAKGKWVRTKDSRGKDTVVQEGNTFDGYSKIDYVFDFVFEVRRQGDTVTGLTHKTRDAAFPRMMTFPFSYDEIAERYGRELLEREAVTEDSATPEQVTRIETLLKLTGWPEESEKGGRSGWAKWLDKASADSWSQMTQTQVASCITHIEKTIEDATQ